MNTPIKKASDNDLSELLDLFGQIINRMNDYSHVEDYCKTIYKKVEDFQSQLYKELEFRENQF